MHTFIMDARLTPECQSLERLLSSSQPTIEGKAVIANPMSKSNMGKPREPTTPKRPPKQLTPETPKKALQPSYIPENLLLPRQSNQHMLPISPVTRSHFIELIPHRIHHLSHQIVLWSTAKHCGYLLEHPV